MNDYDFQITSRARAKEVFPRRLREVAGKAHGYAPGDDYGLNADIAKRCRVTRGAVTRWFAGSLPKLETLITISEAYTVDPAWLVGNDIDQVQNGEGMAPLSSRLSYETVAKVLRIMSEVRRDAGADLSDNDFASASVEIMRMVERDPAMPEYAITGAAYRLLKGSLAANGD